MTDRHGFVLLTALLLTLMLSLLSLGVVTTGLRESRIARAAQDRADGAVGTEAAALGVAAAWSATTFSDMDVGADTAVPTAVAGASGIVSRVDSALFLIETRWDGTTSPGAPSALRRGLLVTSFDPAALLAAFPAAATVLSRAELRGGSVSGLDPCGAPAPALLASAVDQHPAAVVMGAPGVALGPPPPLPVRSPFDPALAPTVAGVEAPVPFVHVEESYTLAGERRQGVWVVDGDLRVTGGSEIQGIVVVRGTLEIDEDSRIAGAVRAGALVLRSGLVQRDRCVLAEVVRASALDRAFRPGERLWVPAF